MKILITGGAGYIGSVVTQLALQRGHEVAVCDVFWYGSEGVRDMVLHPRLLAYDQDFRTLGARALDPCDAVIHAAGFSNDPTADADPELNRQINEVGTDGLARAAVAAGVRHITFMSSASIYDGALQPTTMSTPLGRPFGEQLSESTPVMPRGAYAETKYWAELSALQRTAGSRTHLTIFRQGTVFGLSPRMRFDLVVNSMVRDAVCKGQIVVHLPGNQVRPIVSVAEVARAHLWAIERNEVPEQPELFNLVSMNVSINALAYAVGNILRHVGVTVECLTAPSPGRVRDYAADPTALNSAMGFLKDDLTEQVIAMVGYVQALVAKGEDPYAARFQNLDALREKGILQ